MVEEHLFEHPTFANIAFTNWIYNVFALRSLYTSWVNLWNDLYQQQELLFIISANKLKSLPV